MEDIGDDGRLILTLSDQAQRSGPPGVVETTARTSMYQSEKRGVQAARNPPSEDRKCRQRVELGIYELNRWTVKCLDLSRKRGIPTDKTPQRGQKCWQRLERNRSPSLTPAGGPVTKPEITRAEGATNFLARETWLAPNDLQAPVLAPHASRPTPHVPCRRPEIGFVFPARFGLRSS